jgi:phosphoglycolate phosphatase
MLIELMNELGVAPARTLIVGDTTHDLLMGQNDGCPCVGVSYGAHEHSAFEHFSPVFVAHSVNELHAWLEAHA